MEELLDVRQSGNRQLEFLTKWEGYINDHNTWEKIGTFKRPLSEL